MTRNTNRLFESEDAVSPVIGTIMMVAVTVVLAASIVAVMNGYGQQSVQAPDNLAFKAQAVDSNGNGAPDRIKITYVTGDSNVTLADVTITVTNSTGAVLTPVSAKTGSWNPGDFLIFDPASGGGYFITVSARGNTLVDQTVNVAE